MCQTQRTRIKDVETQPMAFDLLDFSQYLWSIRTFLFRIRSPGIAHRVIEYSWRNIQDYEANSMASDGER